MNERPVANKDQTAASWMKESIVWVSQRITKKLGKEKVEKYLKDFDYGTADMSGGIETAWLNTDTAGTMQISADEQARFLEKFWKGKLPVSKKAIDLTKKITFIETTPKGYGFSGKTGSGIIGPTRLGWFVGHIEKGAENYIVVTNFTDSKNSLGYGGPAAREKTKEILTDLGKF